MGKRNRNMAPVERDDKIPMTGTVIDSNMGLFKVSIEGTENIIICQPSGKIRQNKINIVPGDKVQIEVSPYDLTRGRIMFRL